MAENGHNGQAKVISPNLVPWKPGQSGNPGGRAKSAVISKETRRGIEELDPETGRIRAREVFLAMYEQAKKGNVQAATWLRETCEGKLAETFRGSIDLDHNGLLRAENDAKQKLLEKLRGHSTVTVTQTKTVVTARPLLESPSEPPLIIEGNHLPIRSTASERAERLRQQFHMETTHEQ